MESNSGFGKYSNVSDKVCSQLSMATLTLPFLSLSAADVLQVMEPSSTLVRKTDEVSTVVSTRCAQ